MCKAAPIKLMIMSVINKLTYRTGCGGTNLIESAHIIICVRRKRLCLESTPAKPKRAGAYKFPDLSSLLPSDKCYGLRRRLAFRWTLERFACTNNRCLVAAMELYSAQLSLPPCGGSILSCRARSRCHKGQSSRVVPTAIGIFYQRLCLSDRFRECLSEIKWRYSFH